MTKEQITIGTELKLVRLPIYARKQSAFREVTKIVSSVSALNDEDLIIRFKGSPVSFFAYFNGGELVSISSENARYEPIN